MLFSVIVANYNNAPYLDELVESLYNQTYRNWELIIADDCSTDNSLEIIKKHKAKDKRVKYAVHDLNRKAGAAFKTAAGNAKGEIIGMLGADDALVENALEIMVEAHAKQPDSSIITSKSIDCDGDMNPIGLCDISGEQPEGISFIDEIHVSNFVTFKASAYKRTSGFDPDQVRAVDHDIMMKLEEVGDIGFVDTPLYLYRRHLGGISQGDNGLKAANYSLKARMKAYKRRLKSGFQPNLSHSEYVKISLLYYQRTSYRLRKERHFLKSIDSNLKCLFVKPSYIFSRDFWAVFYHVSKELAFK